uniref:D-alanyl-D-alanine carboxypeptidase family protein n=1 Tax=uncultured Allobacillus sp. TaxID=1638025 RepID=UPI002591F21B|nr:D-alanyl-D-alanine carboxypeptidase family protein [uncultured Allobacillus sp.]
MNKLKIISILIIVFLFFNVTPIYADTEDEVELYSESAILMDANSGVILYEKQKDKEMYPASITKIISGLMTIREGNLEDIVTVSQHAREAEGTRVYLEEGEEVTLKKLVQGLLINSGNDAGIAIAEHLDGSEEAFARRMTDFVRNEVGVTNTTFKNPHGLPDPDHVTTAYDMALITAYAMENQTFREIVGTRELKWVGESWDTTLRNHHQLVLQRDDVTGVKNGYTDDAGFTLSTTAEDDGIELVIVTLNAEHPRHAYMDTERLIEYGYQYQTETIPSGEEFTDEEGEQYVLDEPITFTVKKGQNWTTEMATDGLLSIRNEAEESIFEYQFPVDEIKTDDKPVYGSTAGGKTNPNPTDSDGPGLWRIIMYTILFSSILIVAGLLFMRIKKKRTTKQEQSPIVIESYKDPRPWRKNW